MDHVEELCEQLCIMHHGEAIVGGSLREVKRGFGRQNVRLKADFDLSFLSQIEGVNSFKPSIEGGLFQISEESTAHALLRAALTKGEIRHFAIEEPSLQDIFIEKVGKEHA
jgi:ABC-2 type transport system ATP-binding protein